MHSVVLFTALHYVTGERASRLRSVI